MDVLSHDHNMGNSKGQISPGFQQVNDKGKMREKELLQFKRDLRDLSVKRNGQILFASLGFMFEAGNWAR